MGAGKWRKDFGPIFDGADVVICGDNDEPGRDHVLKVARMLKDHAARIRLLDLKPIWPQIEESNDITDWFEAGHKVEELWQHVEQLPTWDADKPGQGNGRDKGDAAGLEDAVALDFAALHTDDYRYVAQTSNWLRWNATRWQAEKTLAAFDVSRSLCRQAGDGRAKTVAAVVTLARTDRRIAATVEQWDRDPDLLNCGAVTFDLKTGQERPPIGSTTAPSKPASRLRHREHRVICGSNFSTASPTKTMS